MGATAKMVGAAIDVKERLDNLQDAKTEINDYNDGKIGAEELVNKLAPSVLGVILGSHAKFAYNQGQIAGGVFNGDMSGLDWVPVLATIPAKLLLDSVGVPQADHFVDNTVYLGQQFVGSQSWLQTGLDYAFGAGYRAYNVYFNGYSYPNAPSSTSEVPNAPTNTGTRLP